MGTLNVSDPPSGIGTPDWQTDRQREGERERGRVCVCWGGGEVVV